MQEKEKLAQIFRKAAPFTIEASAVAGNPAFYTYGDRALPTSTVITMLLEAPGDQVDAAGDHIKATPVATIEPTNDHVEDQAEDHIEASVDHVEPGLFEDALLPFDDKFEQIFDTLRRTGYYDDIKVIKESYNHPMIELYEKRLAGEEGLLNYRAVSFSLRGAPDKGEALGNVPDVSGTAGHGVGAFGGEVYRGERVVVYACITIGSWKPNQSDVDELNNGYRQARAQGPFIIGYIGETSETGDPIYLNVMAEGFVPRLARLLPSVAAYKTRQKEARNNATAANKERFERLRAAGINPTMDEWYDPNALEGLGNTTGSQSSGVSHEDFAELKGEVANLTANLSALVAALQAKTN